jgi:PIN domain nuclease of toxin-antitoxin system
VACRCRHQCVPGRGIVFNRRSLGALPTALILDTHVVHWWSSEPDRLSEPASRAISQADELAVSAITWFELAWLANHGRIAISIPLRTWLGQLDVQLRTFGITPEIAATAVSLPPEFPGDPADRLIYSTAVETGYRLVTKDQKLRAQPDGTPIAVW